MSKTSLELMQERYATLVEKLQETYGGNAAVECCESHVHVPPGMYPSVGLLHMLDSTTATIRRQEEIATKLEENLTRLQLLPHDARYPFDLENVTTQIANARAHKAMAEENLVLQRVLKPFTKAHKVEIESLRREKDVLRLTLLEDYDVYVPEW